MRRRDFLAISAHSVVGMAAAWSLLRSRRLRAEGLGRDGRSEEPRDLRPGDPLRILMLGGTNFVGPHLVRTASQLGHEVTLFNRGVTNPGLFPDLEHLRGNRYPDRGQGLGALEGTRAWDAVLDTWQGPPGCVDRTARMLAGRTRRYLYISSIATYRHYREVGMTEEAPLLDATDLIGALETDAGYALRKRAAEQAVERGFGPRGTVLRCGSIGGAPGSPDGPAEPGYWSYRFLIGEPLLAPDDPTAFFQLIDVKDVAAFALRAIERGFGGAFNVVGPEEPLRLRRYLRAWSEVTGRRSPIVWADPEWLRERGVRPFEDIRNWIPGDDPEPGFYRIANRKALDHGLTCRPLEATIRDSIAGSPDPGELVPPAAGLGRERELELIEAWRDRPSGV